MPKLHFNAAVEFGRELIGSGDLDPVYVAMTAPGVRSATQPRCVVAYSCLYHLGASTLLAQSTGVDFWHSLTDAAVNEGLRWPRGSERRHWRGANAIRSARYFSSNFLKPENVVKHWISGGESFAAVAAKVQQAPSFGPWIAFKVADLLERVLGYSIDFSDCAMGVYDEPRRSAALILTGDADAPITNEDLTRLMSQMLQKQHLGKALAPPRRDRSVNVQEAETVLCKYKAHVNGHYPLGKDTREVLHGLRDERWDCADTRAMIRAVERLPYAS